MISDYLSYLLCLIAGVGGGIINTLSGGASIFILSVLLLFGIPPDIANGTNRLGIFAQTLTGTVVFRTNGLLDFYKNLPFIIPSLIGAIIGAFFAVDLSREYLRVAIGISMVFILFNILYTPRIKFSKEKPFSSKLISFIIFLGIGFYGGFIQAGVGLVIITVLSKWFRISLVDGNGIKMLIILLYTLPVLLIFIIHDQVNWILGACIAIGQLIGSWMASFFAIKSSKSGIIIHYLLIIMVIISIIDAFELIDYTADFIFELFST